MQEERCNIDHVNNVSKLTSARLMLDPDGINHGSVQPGSKMSPVEFNFNILQTRDDWEIH